MYLSIQAQEILQGTKNWTIHSDETTLSGIKLQTYSIAFWDDSAQRIKNIVLAIEEVAEKTAATSVETFWSALKNLANPTNKLSEAEAEKTFVQMLKCIKNCSGDSASTQRAFNKQLAERISKYLGIPWTINTINCELHVLANFFDNIGRVLNAEENYRTGQTTTGSIVKDAVVAVCHVLGERSASSVSIAKQWESYAEGLPITDFKFRGKYGKRWNVAFNNAAILYQHREHVLNFLNSIPDLPDNLTLTKKVLSSTFHLSLLHALAMLDFFVNGYLWEMFDSPGTPILEAATLAQEVVDFIDHVIQNPEEIVNAPYSWLTDKKKKYEDVFNNMDQMFMEIIPSIFEGTSKYLKDKMGDILRGGILTDPSKAEELKSASGSNKISEQVFGITDYSKKRAPNISVERMNIVACMKKNDFFGFLENATNQKRTKIRELVQGLRRWNQNKVAAKKLNVATKRRAYLETKTKSKKRRQSSPDNPVPAVGTEIEYKFEENGDIIIAGGHICREDADNFELKIVDSTEKITMSRNDFEHCVDIGDIVILKY